MKRFDIQYFGTISSFQQILKESHIAFCKDSIYKKMCFTNRCIIVSSQGTLSLSIPIKGGRNQSVPLQEIEMAHEAPWQTQHIKSIESNYKRAPFYEYYIDSLKDIICSNQTHLFPYLMQLHEWTRNQLKGEWEILTPVEQCQEIELHEDYRPNNYFQHKNPIQYTQVFETFTGFHPNVCILDLLFCVGGRTAKKMLS